MRHKFPMNSVYSDFDFVRVEDASANNITMAFAWELKPGDEVLPEGT